MTVSQVDIFNLRNITETSLKLTKSNLLLGKNGSGKTSVLEALHLLSYGKSFRSNSIDSVIQHDKGHLVVRGVVDDVSVGVQRYKSGKYSIRYGGTNITKVSELSRMLPIHVVEPNSIAIVEGAPSERRRFLDFSMFHVEHSYLEILKGFNASLKQRNALLKLQSGGDKQLSYWNSVFAENAWNLNVVRKKLFDQVLLPGFLQAKDLLLADLDITFEYQDGCKNAESHEDFCRYLDEGLSQDLKFKATQIGPQRADILLKYKGKLAKDYLSRGQKKLLTYGVRLAPALMLRNQDKNVGLILIDDMPSELDEVSAGKVCQLVMDIKAQAILTAVDETNNQTRIIKETLNPTMFHVEHGTVKSFA